VAALISHCVWDTVYLLILIFLQTNDAEREQSPVALLPETWEEIKNELAKAVIDFTNSAI
jgi:hypothetical protein